MADNPQIEIEVADNTSPTFSTSALQTTNNTRVGDLTETAPASDTASSGLNGRLQRIAQRITSLIALFPSTLGQKTMSGSLAVTVASDQSSYPVTANAGTNLNTSALALETTQVTQNTRIGDLTETAPASDTASSGLNGRLQRIAQRITSLIGLLPASLGQKTMANSLAVVVASDQSNIPVTFVNVSSKPFVAVAKGVSIGSGKSMISLVNASGSLVKIKIRQLWIKNVQTAGVTGIVAEFQMNSIVNHSAGTSLTPKAYDSSDTLNGSVTARTGATITSEGTTWRRWLWSSDEWGPGPQDNETNEHTAHNTIPHYEDKGQWKPITLNANEGIHIKQVTNSTAGTFDLELVFTVEG